MSLRRRAATRHFIMLGFLLGSVTRRSLASMPSTGRTASSCSPRPMRSGAATTCAVVSEGKKVVGGPVWRIDSEYESLASANLRADLDRVKAIIDKVRALEGDFKPLMENVEDVSVTEFRESGALDAMVKTSELQWEARKLLGNVMVFANCESSVDGRNTEARKISSEGSEIGARLREALLSKDIFMTRCSDDVVDTFLQFNDKTADEKALLAHARKLRDSRLTLAEEKLLTSLGVHGYTTWGKLYSTLASTIQCKVTLQDGTSTQVGIASAAAMLDSTSEDVRRAAWEGIRDGWELHKETCAAALNAMVGWRLEQYKRRGVYFLDVPLHQNHMTRPTLEAMLKAVEDRSELARRVMRTKASLLGKDKLDAWDLSAPPPAAVGDDGSDLRYTFDEAITLIQGAVSKVHPSMGDFVQMMADRGWIEARTADSKMPGAYMTSFAKSRTPRVYMSNFNGGAPHVLTLAHELGHAFHDWVMRDLPLAKTSIGMNVAETASIFFETIVSGALLADAKEGSSERLRLLWAATSSAPAFLLNIPARFRFEEQLHIRRDEQNLSVDELNKIMETAWWNQYKDTLSSVEAHFWQSKLHFYITGVNFYNFPYTFGWLLALGVYGQRDSMQGSFHDAYTALLRDTGSLDTEDLVSRHLQQDTTTPEFWNESLDAVEKQVEAFEQEATKFVAAKTPETVLSHSE